MKRILTYFALFLIFSSTACKNPLKNVQLYMKNDFFKYTVTLSIKDAARSNISINNAIITVSGQDGQYIYDRDGKQAFSVNSGLVDFSVSPSRTPTASNPVSFIVNISGPAGSNYLPVTKIITIDPSQTSQKYTIRLLNCSTGNTPPGIGVGGRTINMTGGGLSKPGYSGSRTTGGPSSGSDSFLVHDIDFYMPGGVSFYYYTAPNGVATGTKSLLMSHDSSLTSGILSSVYRPISNYYLEEQAQPYSNYTKTTYTGSSVTLYYLYVTDTTTPLSPFTIYPLGTTANSISTLNGSSSYGENTLIFKSATRKRLVAYYFVGYLSNGQAICISPTNYPTIDSLNWYFSFKLDTSKLPINSISGLPFTAGDNIETGINYVPGSYPIFAAGTTFTPSSLSTSHNTIRRSTYDNSLRVECQSTDAGIYQEALFNQPFSYNFDATIDTGTIPDLENLYANAVISVASGSTTTYFTYPIIPNYNFSFSGNILAVSATPSFAGNINVMYWDSLISTQPLPAGGTGTIRAFAGPFAGPTYNSTISRFYYTFKCKASGTNRIVEPTYFGAIHGVGVGGRTLNGYCNVRGGYWSTKTFAIGATINDTIRGNACGNLFYITTPTIGTFNTGEIDNDLICSCYFHF